MSWKCQCGQDGNIDAAVFCPSCGAPKPEVLQAAPSPPPFAPLPPPSFDPPPPPAGPPPAPPEAPAAALPPPAVAPEEPAAKKKGLPCFVWVLIAIPAALLVTCVIGIIASIAVPNFLQASGRGKQKRAMQEVKAISVVCGEYAVDHGGYPDTGRPTEAYYGFVEADKLKSLVEPSYIKDLPTKDPWGNPYLYGISQNGQEMVVICTGSDGLNKLEAIPETPKTTDCFEDEIVCENGTMVQYPEGRQRKCG